MLLAHPSLHLGWVRQVRLSISFENTFSPGFVTSFSTLKKKEEVKIWNWSMECGWRKFTVYCFEHTQMYYQPLKCNSGLLKIEKNFILISLCPRKKDGFFVLKNRCVYFHLFYKLQSNFQVCVIEEKSQFCVSLKICWFMQIKLSRKLFSWVVISISSSSRGKNKSCEHFIFGGLLNIWAKHSPRTWCLLLKL